MTFSTKKKPFQNTVQELMTYPVPQFEGYASQHRGSLLFCRGEPNLIIVGKTGAGKVFHAPHGKKFMKNRVLKVEGDK
ncbi:hypothetical protein AHR11_004545 [Salmonella enterica subsp. enterica serovar Havana]|nr:hypothetical protein [Salmonella enterica subsp. enterica serovar Havana]